MTTWLLKNDCAIALKEIQIKYHKPYQYYIDTRWDFSIRTWLKHGVLLRPKEPEIIAIAENIYEQIEKHNVLKDNHISKVKAQTGLKSFT